MEGRIRNADPETPPVGDYDLAGQAACRLLSIVCALIAAVFAVAALTMHSVSATTPAIFMLGLAAAAYLLWPKKK